MFTPTKEVADWVVAIPNYLSSEWAYWHSRKYHDSNYIRQVITAYFCMMYNNMSALQHHYLAFHLIAGNYWILKVCQRKLGMELVNIVWNFVTFIQETLLKCFCLKSKLFFGYCILMLYKIIKMYKTKEWPCSILPIYLSFYNIYPLSPL